MITGRVTWLNSVDGYALVGDIEILKNEIEFYFEQFDLTDKRIKQVDSSGNKKLVWDIIRDGEGQGQYQSSLV